MKRNEWVFLVGMFAIWRVGLQLVLALSSFWWELNPVFLGGGVEVYTTNPGLWAWGNFDGVHYLSIAMNGYLPLTHFYFPAYPMLVRVVTAFFDKEMATYFITMLIVSHTMFVVGLIGFYKLCKFEFNKKIACLSVVTLLVFPTSFYFAAAYTESLFFGVVVWSFYFARKNKWALASAVGAFASATRIIGAVLLPAYVVGYLISQRKIFVHGTISQVKNVIANIVKMSFVITGLVLYMYYLHKTSGDMLLFFRSVEIFGEYREQFPVLLPQIFYRYIFKIIPSLTWSYFPVVFTTLLEFAVGTILTIASIWGIKRLQPTYLLYMIGAFITPTLSSGFVSLPRYALAVFPVFFLAGVVFSRLQAKYFYMYLIFSSALLIIAASLFFRGYWVS